MGSRHFVVKGRIKMGGVKGKAMSMTKTMACCVIICLVPILSCRQGEAAMHYTKAGTAVQITGMLGRPLGEIVTVKGTVIENTIWRAANETEELLLEVDSIDGKPLDDPVRIPFGVFPWCGCGKPAPGNPFNYVGYETGGMTGIPEKAFDYMSRVAAREYGFTVYFQVCGEAR
ncbi:MAG: hypothetical protein JW881_11315 [Spirochaetales bacterium]|nr:hypothetical protein [Spirochaetales bacterium]